MAWRITYTEETHMYRVPQQRGPGPLRKIIWAILGLGAGGAVMWFLVRGLPAGEWDRLKQNPVAEAQRVGGAIVSEAQKPAEVPTESSPGAVPEQPESVPQQYEGSPAARDEMAYMEVAVGRVRMEYASLVFEQPDSGSRSVGQVAVEEYVRVRGTTPNFLQVQIDSGAVGYVSFTAALVLELERWKRCYTIEASAPLLRNPNAHSEKVGDAGDGVQAIGVGEGLGNYPYIRTADGVEGYVVRNQVLAQVQCPNDDE